LWYAGRHRNHLVGNGPPNLDVGTDADETSVAT
jgi:hypothetical protein